MYPVYLVTCTHPSYGQHIMPYVGVVLAEDKTVEDRFKDHCHSGTTKHKSRLYSAIKKHGKEWFKVEQIDAGNTPEQALELEKWWIKRLGTFGSGYNLTEGGTGGNTWGHRSEESKQKHIESVRNSWKVKEIREKHVAARLAVWKDDTARRETVSKVTKQRWTDGVMSIPEVPWNKGTVGVCKPNSGSFAKGHRTVITEETRQKMRQPRPHMQGKPWSEARRKAYDARREGTNEQG